MEQLPQQHGSAIAPHSDPRLNPLTVQGTNDSLRAVTIRHLLQVCGVRMDVTGCLMHCACSGLWLGCCSWGSLGPARAMEP